MEIAYIVFDSENVMIGHRLFLLGLLVPIVNLQAQLMTEAGKFIKINSIGVISFSPANYCYGKEARKFMTESFFIVFLCLVLKLEVERRVNDIYFHINVSDMFWIICWNFVDFSSANSIEKGAKIERALEMYSHC